ncbi:carboxypeptidase-like regulatory domain-containing protein [Deinococcus sonorensis]|uniref:Carboxypeptidase-like regulatory domain-containing protein n=2 Tax=Deinococcus sonorensis TaxID=309891 RepID=A0AAU7U4G8_9DEIO
MHRRMLAPLLALSTALASAGAAPGTVQGQALDTHGKPLAGVQVWIKPVVTTGVAETLTDDHGRYAVSGLPSVGYRSYAWLQAPYKGKTFCYRLAQPNTADYNAFNPRDGLTRNFKWQLSGQIPGEEPYSDLGYFGGSLPLMSAFGQARWATQNDEIELQLTPVGPLIDGSAGKAITKTAPARGMVLDVPIGTYQVKATFISANGKREALQVSAFDGDYSASATVNFKPSGDICKGTTGGAPGRAYVYWKFQ